MSRCEKLFCYVVFRGVKEVLRKRLKNFYKKRKLAKAKVHQLKKKNFDYFAVIDFEATCEENNDNFSHEIIEFPVILVDLSKLEIVSYHIMGTSLYKSSSKFAP